MTEEPRYPEFNGWQAVRSLGAGACGETFEISRDDGFGLPEHGALKVLRIPVEPDADADEVARLRAQMESMARQLRAVSSLGEQRNILPCRDHAIRRSDDGSGWEIYLRYELATPLDEYLRTHTYGEADVARLGAGVCTALEACRSRGVLHGDIKPQNIFVTGGNFEDAIDFRLGDFGMAAFAAADATNDFAAPEVLCGEPCSTETDLYSLAMVLYWMLNERRIPFVPLPPAGVSGSDLAIARDMRLRGDPLPQPVHGSGALRAVIMRALADQPGARYSSAAEFRSALLGAVRRERPCPAPARAPVVEPAPEEPEEAVRENEKKRKKPMLIIGGIVVAALVLLILIMALAGGSSGTMEITLDQTQAELAPGDTLQLTATVTDSSGAAVADPEITWTSASKSVATVSDGGLVTAVAEGKAKITAKVDSVSAECTVTVTKDAIEITGVRLSQDVAQLTVGDTLTLTATLSPADAPEDSVSWTSSDPAVATVKKGVVTAVAAGSATITVRAGEKSASCAVTVQAASSVASISCGTSAVTFDAVGDATVVNFTVTGTGLENCAGTAKAYALDTSVVQVGTVTHTGGSTSDTYVVPITALRAGTTVVAFQLTDADGDEHSATVTVTVRETVTPTTEPDDPAEP